MDKIKQLPSNNYSWAQKNERRNFFKERGSSNAHYFGLVALIADVPAEK